MTRHLLWHGGAQHATSLAIAVGLSTAVVIYAERSLSLALIAAAVSLLFALAASGRNSRLQAILLVAFSVRIFVAIIDTYVGRVPGSGADSFRFEMAAAEWSRTPTPQYLAEFGTGSLLLSWLAAALYRAVGESALMIKVIMALFGMLTVRNTFAIAKELWGSVAAARAGWIAALFPTLALFSGVFLREAPLGLLLSYGALVAIRGVKYRRVANYVAAVAIGALGAALHTGMIAFLAGLIIVAILETARNVRHRQSGGVVRSTALALLVVGGVAVLAVTGWGLDRLGGSLESLTFERIESNLDAAARGDAAYLTGFTVASPTDAIWKGPIRLAYFLTTPFPWMVRSAGHLLGFLDAAFFAAALFLAYRNRRWIARDPAKMALIALFITVSFVFALGTSNFGTALRHRAKFVPLLIPLVVVLPRERRADLGTSATPSIHVSGASEPSTLRGQRGFSEERRASPTTRSRYQA